MRKALVIMLLLVLVGCGDAASPQPTPDVQASVRSGAQTAVAATIGAMPIPTTTAMPATMPPSSEARGKLVEGGVATLPGVASITVKNLQSRTTAFGATAQSFQLDIENLSRGDLAFAPCSFVMRASDGMDYQSTYCNSKYTEQGATTITPGGKTRASTTFEYSSRTGLSGQIFRFVPTVPTGVRLFMDAM